MTHLKTGRKGEGEGEKEKKRNIRQMFSLAAEQRIQADGIHTEGEREKRNASWLIKICTGGVKNQLHLSEWPAHTHNKGSGGNDITSGKRILPTQVSAWRCGKIFFRPLNSKSNELGVITIKRECSRRIKRKDESVAGCDNANDTRQGLHYS